MRDGYLPLSKMRTT